MLIMKKSLSWSVCKSGCVLNRTSIYRFVFIETSQQSYTKILIWSTETIDDVMRY